MNLQELKKNYGILQKKYALPTFKELNENFDIEKIDRDTELLLKVIRKNMVEKIISSLGFVEILLTPMNSPRLYINYLKTMTQEDKKQLELIYNKLGELNISAIECEIDYNEKREAEVIKKIFITWNELKPEFIKLLQKIRKPSDFSNMKKERSYFG